MNKIINFKNIKKLFLEIWLAYITTFFRGDIMHPSGSKYNPFDYECDDFPCLCFIVISVFITIPFIGLIIICLEAYPFLWCFLWIVPVLILMRAIKKGFKNFNSEEKEDGD